VDATQTHTRLQILLETGHSIEELARALGRSSASLRRTLDRRTVTAHTATSVGDLFDHLQRNVFDKIPGAVVSLGNNLARPRCQVDDPR
jgi:hypothetical protein